PPGGPTVAPRVPPRLVLRPLRRRHRPRGAGHPSAAAAHRGGVLMPIAKAWSAGLVGINGRVIEIEADLGGGLSRITLVGLPDAGLREAKDRVRSAVRNSGQPWPDGKVTLGLSPANLPKVGSGYDLGIAAAVLAANGAVPATKLLRTILLGELAL